MNNEHEVITLERRALDRWCAGDPSGYMELFADDVAYFDPFLPERLDGRENLTAYYEKLRGKVTVPRYEMRNAKVQEIGEAAVLTFNFIGFDDDENEYRWNSTEVYRWSNTGWQLIQSHWSLTQPVA